MSLYNMLFGSNPIAPVLIEALELETVGRYRDAWVEKTENGRVRIAIHTRNGGGNREICWCHENTPDKCSGPDSIECARKDGCTACIANHLLPAHPLHIMGVDDDFDSTYRTDYFDLPEKYREELTALALEKPYDPGEAWQTLIARLQEASA